MAAKAMRNLKRPNSGTDPARPLIWLAAAGIALLYVVLRVHAVGIPLDRDEGTFGYIGRTILDGGLPYRDAIDHKPPVVFYLYALALLAVPATEKGIHLFLQGYNLLTLICLFYLMKVRFRSLSPALWGAFSYALFSSSPAIQGFTASAEMLMLLPVTLCLLFAVRAVRSGSAFLLVASGMAGALAFWTKQTAITSALFALIYVASATGRDVIEGSRRRRYPMQSILLWAAGAAVISLLIAAYFYDRGIFQEFFYWSFLHNIAYAARLPLSQQLALLAPASAEILRGDFPILAVAGASAVWGLARREKEGYFIAGFFIFSLLGVLPGFAYRHYFAQLAPAVAVAAGWGISRLLAAIPRAGSRTAAVLFGSACLMVIPVGVHHGVFLDGSPESISRRYFGSNPFPESREMARFLAARTGPGDPIFIFGSEPQILFYARRSSATPFVTIYPLTSSYPRYREFQQKLWQQLQQTRPKYIVLVNIPTSIGWDGKAELQILMNRLDGMIQTNYSIEAVMVIKDSGSRLLAVDGSSAPDDEIIRSRTNIYIYRAKSN
ncbi:MAG: glycosyltransferase family 39 protein [Acidobacteria bacterium]|nr:glycosyltransferase family 39 protein [Acidobacteriota bacterium]